MNPLNMFRQMRAVGQLLTAAERESRAMGEPEPGAEHLLLAAFDLPDGSAGRILGQFGVDREGLRRAIVEHHAAALASVGIDAQRAAALSAPASLDPPAGTGIYRAGASADEAFQAVTGMARRDKRLLGAHVVAAVADLQHGTAAGVLQALGVDRDALAAASRRETGPAR